MQNTFQRGMRVLNEFEVIKLLGQGNYTSVYLVRSLESNNLGALKMYQGPYQDDPVFRRRFKREFDLTHKLDHPNLVSYKRAGILKDFPYIVMEYIYGKTVKDLLSYHGRIPAQIALPIFSEVLKGLSYLHEQDIMHRDIKPSAIFVDFEGKVKLADFDVAKMNSANENLTEKGALIGSQLYMSPEQRLGGYVDLRTDVFSAGITLYEMIVGKNPWANPDFLPTDHRVWSQLELPSQMISDASPDLDRFILKAIDLQPSRRFSSAEEMLHALHEITDWRYGVASKDDVIKLVKGERISENDIALMQKYPDLSAENSNQSRKLKESSSTKKEVEKLNIRQSEKKQVEKLLVEKDKKVKKQQQMTVIVALVGVIATLLASIISSPLIARFLPPTPTVTATITLTAPPTITITPTMQVFVVPGDTAARNSSTNETSLIPANSTILIVDPNYSSCEILVDWNGTKWLISADKVFPNRTCP